MCGRFNVASDPLSQLLLALVGLRHPGPDNVNAAPTETIAVLRLDEAGEPAITPMRWWLTPFWAKEISTRYSMFNAKSETAHKSPAFREPFRKRRCVVPVSGFYEWARHKDRKLAYLIQASDQPGLLLAGLWDRWRDPETDEELLSFTILTEAATPAMAVIHSRQPVMLTLAGAHRWLDPATPAEELDALLEPAIPLDLDAVPVSSHVNNARHKDARCLEPVGEPLHLPAERGDPP